VLIAVAKVGTLIGAPVWIILPMVFVALLVADIFRRVVDSPVQIQQDARPASNRLTAPPLKWHGGQPAMRLMEVVERSTHDDGYHCRDCIQLLTRLSCRWSDTRCRGER
jgi:hypothetical protein